MYKCDCSKYCGYLRNVSKSTYYAHTKYRDEDYGRSCKSHNASVVCLSIISSVTIYCILVSTMRAVSSSSQPLVDNANSSLQSTQIRYSNHQHTRSHSPTALPGKRARLSSSRCTSKDPGQPIEEQPPEGGHAEDPDLTQGDEPLQDLPNDTDQSEDPVALPHTQTSDADPHLESGDGAVGTGSCDDTQDGTHDHDEDSDLQQEEPENTRYRGPDMQRMIILVAQMAGALIILCLILRHFASRWTSSNIFVVPPWMMTPSLQTLGNGCVHSFLSRLPPPRWALNVTISNQTEGNARVLNPSWGGNSEFVQNISRIITPTQCLLGVLANWYGSRALWSRLKIVSTHQQGCPRQRPRRNYLPTPALTQCL